MDSADLQLQQIEHVCDRLYNATNEHERADAQRSVLALSENAEHIPLCRHVLDRSHSSALLIERSSARPIKMQKLTNAETGSRRRYLQN